MPPTPSPTYERLRETIAQAHADEPRLPAPDAHGAPGPRIGQSTASPAPAQDVARRILGEDVTQIDYNTERVKRMVWARFTFDGITRYDQGAYGLVGGEKLSDRARRAAAAVPLAPR